MNLKLEARYLQLEKTRRKLLNELTGLDDTVLNTAAVAGAWSVNQVVAHLVMVDELTVGYMQRKLQQPDKLHPLSFVQSCKALLLKLALKSWLKFKAPSVVATVPDSACLPDLIRRWDTIRFTLEDLLAAYPEELQDKCIFKHPIAGPLSIQQTLSFLQDHFDHHLPQIHHQKKLLTQNVLQQK